MTHTIRNATIRDLNAFSSLVTATFLETFGHLYAPQDLETYLRESYDDEVLRQELDNPATVNLLAEAEGMPVGFVKYGSCKLPITHEPAPVMELHRLYVLKSHHRQGIGKILMDATMQDMHARGTKSIFLGVWEGNQPAQAFYENYGFKQAGEYLFYVGSHADRELILKKLL